MAPRRAVQLRPLHVVAPFTGISGGTVASIPRRLAVVALPLSLVACGAPSVMLVNDQGHYVRCEMQSFWTDGGGPFAYSKRNECIKAYEAVGYKRVTPHEE